MIKLRFSVQFDNVATYTDFENDVKRLHPTVTLKRVESESYNGKVNYILETEQQIDVLLIGMCLSLHYRM